MSRTMGSSMAVPLAALAPDGAALAFEGAAWRHLGAWLGKVEALAPGQAADAPELAGALNGIVRLAAGFGGPAQARAARTSASMPPHAYAGFTWLVGQLLLLAQETHALLEALGAQASAPERRRQALDQLGELAARARDLGSPLLPKLEEFRAAAVHENAAFSAALQALGATLQACWEAVGAQRARLEQLQAQLKATSALHPGKRRELAAAIEQAEEDLDALTRDAEALRLRAAALGEIGDEGVWLDAGVGAMLDFLHALRAAWANFGSAVTQLGADAGPDRLDSPDWIAAQLMLEQALPRWQALATACLRFGTAPGALPASSMQAQKVQP